MKTSLKDLWIAADERDCELISEELDSLRRSATLPKDAQERILSAVMKKAGFEMKETMIKTGTKKRKKRMIGFMAAAVVALTGAIGAGANIASGGRLWNAMKFRFTGEGDLSNNEIQSLESITSHDGEITENSFEGLDIAFDGAVCNGVELYTIFTLRKSDGSAFTAPEGYVWHIGFEEGGIASLFSDTPKVPVEKNWSPFDGVINDDGSLTVTISSDAYMPNNWFYDYLVGFTDLYCVPEDLLHPDMCNLAVTATAAESNGEAEAEEYFSEYNSTMEAASTEHFRGTVICKLEVSSLPSAASMPSFTAEYRGSELTLELSPLGVYTSCYECKGLKKDEAIALNDSGMWVSLLELNIVYKDGTVSEPLKSGNLMVDGKEEVGSFHISYIPERPLDPSQIAAIIFDGVEIPIAD